MGGVLAVELSMACSLSIASALSVTQAQTLQPTPERATDHAPPDASSTLARSQYLRSLSRRHSVTILCRQFTVKWRVTCFDVVRTTLCTNRTTDRMLARRSDLRGGPGGPSDRSIRYATTAGLLRIARYHRDPTTGLLALSILVWTYSTLIRTLCAGGADFSPVP